MKRRSYSLGEAVNAPVIKRESFGSSKESPLVSVILPTHNRGPMLAQAIESVLSQSFDDLELIVVDDGSTDKTAEIAKAYGGLRLKYLKHENRGVSAARNTGLSAAAGELIAFSIPTICSFQINLKSRFLFISEMISWASHTAGISSAKPANLIMGLR